MILDAAIYLLPVLPIIVLVAAALCDDRAWETEWRRINEPRR